MSAEPPVPSAANGESASDASIVERIRAVNHHLRFALDQVSDAVWIAQRGEPEGEYVIVYANAAAERWTGLSAEQLWRTPLAALLSDAALPPVRAALGKAAETGGAECRVDLLKPSAEDPGARVCRVAAVRDAAGAVVSFQFTLSPAATGAGSKAPAPFTGPPPAPALWHADMIETIRETARQVAHEFNNALTSIVLPVQLAMEAIPRGGELFESLEVAHDSAQRAADLAHDFLDCFRPRPAVRERARPAGFLGRSVRLATCGRNISAVCEIAPDLHEVCVDEAQLERVIFNLIRNAAQAMPGGGRLRVKASNITLPEKTPLGLPPGPYVQITVRDWGPGIPPQHLQHLFHSRFTTKSDGNGCGLAICHRIIRDHGGDMQVRSRVNVGTEFLLYLPVWTPDAAPQPQRHPPPPPRTDNGVAAAPGAPAAAAPAPPVPARVVKSTPAPLPPPPPATKTAPSANGVAKAENAPPKPLLLVIDDEQTVLQALSQLARHLGFDVITAEDSDEGLKAYRERLNARRRCDAVLLDLNLRRGLSGEEIFQALRRMDPDALVLATSGQHDDGEEQRLREKGFAGFLPKPYSMEHFRELMRDALAARRETAEAHRGG